MPPSRFCHFERATRIEKSAPWPPRCEGAVELPNLGNSTGGVNSLRLRLAAKPPPSKRGRQGGRSMTAPTRAAHQSHVIARSEATWQSPGTIYGYMSTDVEATPYREIPTDGIAVLGMTYFYMVASIFTSPAGRQGGRPMAMQMQKTGGRPVPVSRIAYS